MRILLDECVHAGVRDAFPGHAVRTVTESGWRSVKDEQLLPLAEKHFEVFLTVDKRIEQQHALHRFRLAFIIVHVRNNKLESFQQLFPDLLAALSKARPGQIMHIGQHNSRPI